MCSGQVSKARRRDGNLDMTGILGNTALHHFRGSVMANEVTSL